MLHFLLWFCPSSEYHNTDADFGYKWLWIVEQSRSVKKNLEISALVASFNQIIIEDWVS